MRLQRFDYALQPVLQQARWQLDAALAELAASARRLEALKACATAHQDHVSSMLGWMTSSPALSLDPNMARNRVAYLAQAALKTADFEHGIAKAEEALRKLQDTGREKQLRLDAIEQHRQNAENEHRQAQAQKAAAEVDDDWLVRGQWMGCQQAAVNPDKEHLA